MIIFSCMLLVNILCLTAAVSHDDDVGSHDDEVRSSVTNDDEVASAMVSQESCLQLQRELGVTESGYYLVKQSSVYCDMALECGGYKGGWTRVISLNTSRGDSCPTGWTNDYSNGGRYCTGGQDAGCHSMKISTNQVRYGRICGWLRGYQRGSMNAFFPAAYALGTATGYKPEKASSSINGPYVDGISITVGELRKHVWTYAVGLSDDYSYNYSRGGYNCPCAQHPGPDPPSFVQHHYYCESGNTGRYTAGQYYSNDALWDGRGCGTNNNCCAQAGLPWFFRQFIMPITGDIEVRICRDQNNSDEEVIVEQMAIYIQ